MTTGAPPALRGYRLQHLYTLFRLLTDAARGGYSIQLEGTEDLEIFDETGGLLEAIQVKARESAPLTPSSLRTRSGESFFARAMSRLRTAPGSVQHVVSYGDVGPSLRLLETASDTARAALKTYELEDGAADQFSDAFRVTVVDEAEIERAVFEQLSLTVTGAKPEVAFLYLSGWLFRAMEDRQRVTAADVQARLLAVGQYVAEERAHHDEWFRTIRPLVEREIGEEERDTLAQQFYDGVSARFDHVVAGVDVRREATLDAIRSGFEQSNVVVICGASGQGKTALACRYLLDAPPAQWRFEVAELQDLRHAQNVVLALRAHARTGVHSVVWLDVTPRAMAWAQVVDGIRDLQDVQVLVTIREEDWTRAKNAGAAPDCTEIELALEQDEAEVVFADLQRRRVSGEFLDFKDAWAQFGQRGPLLEFTYLVTRGEALRKRLESQIHRLNEEVRRRELEPAELDLLRRIAVASSEGGRVLLKDAVAALALAAPGRTVALFEKEYLIRVSEDRLYAEGLHPIRSQLTAMLLTQDDLEPSWLDSAIAVLPVIDEPDIERFLLHVFAHRPQAEADAVAAFLQTFRPRGATGAAGIVRALLWRGMQQYRAENTAIIEEIRAHVGGAEIAWGILDPAGLAQFNLGLRKNLDEIFGMVPAQREWYAQLRPRVPSNATVFDGARRWLATAGLHVLALTSADWSAVAELVFWQVSWGSDGTKEIATTAERLLTTHESVPLETCADVVLAMSFQGPDARPAIFERLRQELVTRFQRETATFAITNDGDGVMAHYVLPPQSAATAALHDQTIRRVDLLRRLFPDESGFGARAHAVPGMEVFEHDPSHKENIPEWSFPVPWPARVHALFAHSTRLTLPWGDYASAVLDVRRRVVALARDVVAALRKYFGRDKPKPIFELGVDLDEWLAVDRALQRLPRFPNSAVDDFGYELKFRSSVRSVEANDDMAPYQTALNTYANALADFMSNVLPFLRANADFGRPTTDGVARAQAVLREYAAHMTVHMPTSRLAEAVKALRPFQDAYRARFERFAEGQLSMLEEEERTWLWSLWAIWYQFAYDPRQYLNDAARESRSKIEAVAAKYRKELVRQLQALDAFRATIHAEIDRWTHGAGVWITVDVDEASGAEPALLSVVEKTIEVVRPPADFESLERYALDLTWGDVHFVTLVRGKALEPLCRTLNIATLPQPGEDLPAWRLLPQEIDDAVWKRLEIATHPAALAASARQIRTEAALALMQVGALLSLEDAPDPDPAGGPVLEQHWRAATAEVSDHLRRANELAGTLPAALFDDGAASMGNLTDFLTKLADMTEAAAPRAFEPLKMVSDNISGQLVSALDQVVAKAVDAELSPT